MTVEFPNSKSYFITREGDSFSYTLEPQKLDLMEEHLKSGRAVGLVRANTAIYSVDGQAHAITDHVVAAGSGLVIYPQGIARLPAYPLSRKLFSDDSALATTYIDIEEDMLAVRPIDPSAIETLRTAILPSGVVYLGAEQALCGFKYSGHRHDGSMIETMYTFHHFEDFDQLKLTRYLNFQSR